MQKLGASIFKTELLHFCNYVRGTSKQAALQGGGMWSGVVWEPSGFSECAETYISGRWVTANKWISTAENKFNCRHQRFEWLFFLLQCKFILMMHAYCNLTSENQK